MRDVNSEMRRPDEEGADVTVIERLHALDPAHSPDAVWFAGLYNDVADLMAQGATTTELVEVERALRPAIGRWRRGGPKGEQFDAGIGAGWLHAIQEDVVRMLRPRPSPAAVAAIEPGSLAMRVLALLDVGGEMRSSDLAAAAEVDPTQISRTGRQLLNLLLATRASAGREGYWRISTKGKVVLDDARRRNARRDSAPPTELPMPGPKLISRFVDSQEAGRRARAKRKQLLSSTMFLAHWMAHERGRQKLSNTLFAYYDALQDAGSELHLTAVDASVGATASDDYWSELAKFVDCDIKGRFREYWPAQAPSWQIQGELRMTGGASGVVFVDVPTQPNDIGETVCLDDPEEIDRATRALKDTVETLGLRPELGCIRHVYPNWLSYLVLTSFLRREHDVSAWTAQLCLLAPFETPWLGDLPTRRDTWKEALTADIQELEGDADCLEDLVDPHMRLVFEVADPEEQTQPA